MAKVEGILASRGVEPLVLDIESVMANGLSISEDGCALRVDDRSIDLATLRAGWARRFNRPGWGVGVQGGSLEALEMGAWHSSYFWLLESTEMNWITEPKALRRAESKLRQWKAARKLKIPYPKTLVTSDRDEVVSTFDGEIIAKPLSTGQYLDKGHMLTVFAESMMPTDERLWALKASPFIIQERLRASRHLRIVTVGSRTWTASLPASSKDPADWRRTERNHFRFQVEQDVNPAVESDCLRIANELQLGYSSQDWVETSSGEIFLLDVNPAGQWLFLPASMGLAIAEAIADSLMQST